MDDTVAGLGKGSRVWYRQDAATWLLAEIKDVCDGSISLQLLQSGKSVDVQDGQGQLVPANPALQLAIPDLTQLSYLNEPSILDNLTLRYKDNLIYTNAGPVLIAVNPCRNLPLYTAEVQHEYKSECGSRQLTLHSTFQNSS
jgi:myosin-5